MGHCFEGDEGLEWAAGIGTVLESTPFFPESVAIFMFGEGQVKGGSNNWDVIGCLVATAGLCSLNCVISLIKNLFSP